RKYTGGETPRVSRMGGKDWSEQRNRVRKAVAAVAEQVVDLHRRRGRAKGVAFPADTPWQRELEESFPSEETPDPLTAITARREGLARAAESSPQGGVGCGRAVRRPAPAPGPGQRFRLPRRHTVAARARRVLPLRGDPRPAHRDLGSEGGHGIRRGHGPPRVRRRGLRQDRGGDPGCVQGGTGREAGGGAVSDHAPRPTAPPDLRRENGAVPGAGGGPVAVPHSPPAERGRGWAGG